MKDIMMKLLIFLVIIGSVAALSFTPKGPLNLQNNPIQNASTLNVANVTVTGWMNMTAKNITDVDCVVFRSGGQVCTG